MTNQTPKLRIDIVSDVVCPWCIIGYQRLQAAIAQLQQSEPEVEYEICFQPFELNPNMPAAGQNTNEHIAEKYGSDPATIQANRQSLKNLGLAEGVNFQGDDKSRVYNTFLAHKLLHQAEELDCQEALKLALFRAYFEQQKNISDEKILLAIAVENGFSAEQAQAVINDNDISQAVRERQQQYTRAGISSVPTFIFNQQYSVNGAQDAETLSKVMADIINKPAS